MLIKKLVAECIGTLFLVLLAVGSAVLAGPSIGGLGVGICFGLVLICLCYCIGNVSGCHVNPAVSFAMLIAGKMSGKEFIGYVIAQLVGATIAGGLLWWFTSMASDFNFGGTTVLSNGAIATLGTNVLQPGATSAMAVLAEILLTFFFVLVILGATDDKIGFGKFSGLAIGIALGLVNIVGIPVDNCSVNPARSFGPAMFCPEAWGDFWIMVVGPLVGAAIAVLFYKAIKK
ncbi:MAG: aquaporin [Bacteroides sp.]|nr:aquaporin [Bacteroides sp.]MCM1379739.1 aquaporin [Bacteroides sp.]MCM1445720.1 aquaporin [Prevotella sp.]